MKKVYIVSGGKGGVGKSTVSNALIHFLIDKKDEVLIVDADTSNPDVAKAYNKDSEGIKEIMTINLDSADGWIELINVCDTNKDTTIVVNTPARTRDAVNSYNEILKNSIDELGRTFVTIWVINRQRDSVELLKEYAQTMQHEKMLIHVLRNLYFGDSNKFELYNKSQTREFIESNGGKSLDFPDLADRVTDQMSQQRMTIKKAMKELSIGDRAELMRFVSAAKKVLEEIAQ